MSDDLEKTALEASELAKRCHPIFAGQDPNVVAAALAELLALLLAGHFVPGDPANTQAIRDGILALHIETVKKLVPVMEAMRTAPKLKERMQ
jgi:hypothetical protein